MRPSIKVLNRPPKTEVNPAPNDDLSGPLLKYWGAAMNQAYKCVLHQHFYRETVHVCKTAYTLGLFPPVYAGPILTHFNFSETCCSKCGGEGTQGRKDRVNSLGGKRGQIWKPQLYSYTRSPGDMNLYTYHVQLVRGALKLVSTSLNSLACTDGSN